MFRILVVEDDARLNRVLCAHLGRSGYEAVGCLDANAAYDALYGGTWFDLVISDIMLPGTDGFELARTIRAQNRELPILFLSARDDFPAKREGFSRRLEVGALCLDADERTAYLRGEEVPLTVREFSLLYKLLACPRRTFTRSQLMDEFWESGGSGPRTVDVYITKLRSKFAACEDFEIVTVHGLGYKAVLK